MHCIHSSGSWKNALSQFIKQWLFFKWKKCEFRVSQMRKSMRKVAKIKCRRFHTYSATVIARGYYDIMLTSWLHEQPQTVRYYNHVWWCFRHKKDSSWQKINFLHTKTKQIKKNVSLWLLCGDYQSLLRALASVRFCAFWILLLCTCMSHQYT